MSKGVHNIAFYVSPDPECSRTTQNSEISLAPSRGRILYAIYGNSTCVINHIVVTAIDKRYRNYYVSTHHSEQAILGALALAGDSTTAYARCLVMHGESVYHDLRFLESIALEITSLLAAKGAEVKRKKEEINSKTMTIFGGLRGALQVLEGQDAALQCISNHWRDAMDLLSLGIHVFNGVQCDLTALSEHYTGPQTARLHVPPDK